MDTENVVASLRSRGIELNPPATVEELRNVERRFGPLPAKLRGFFEAANGSGRSYDNEDFVAFWEAAELQPLAEITEEAAKLADDPGQWVVFGDHSIGIVYYAINLGTDEIIIVSTEWKSTSGWWIFARTEHRPASIHGRFRSFDHFMQAYIEERLGAIL